MNRRPRDPFIYSPSRGGMVSLSALQANVGDPVDRDQLDNWFFRAPYIWFALTILLLIALPSIVFFGLTYLFT